MRSPLSHRTTFVIWSLAQLSLERPRGETAELTATHIEKVCNNILDAQGNGLL